MEYRELEVVNKELVMIYFIFGKITAFSSKDFQNFNVIFPAFKFFTRLLRLRLFSFLIALFDEYNLVRRIIELEAKA